MYHIFWDANVKQTSNIWIRTVYEYGISCKQNERKKKSKNELHREKSQIEKKKTPYELHNGKYRQTHTHTLPSQDVDQKSNENKQNKGDRQRALTLFTSLSNEINKNESL